MTLQTHRRHWLRAAIIGFSTCCLAAAVLLAAFDYYFRLPIVQISTSTHDCVRVIYSDMVTDCADLPRKYITENVK